MDTASLKILLITEDTAYCLSARKALERAERHFSVTAVESLAAARTRLAELTPDLVLADERLPDGSGLGLLKTTGHEPP